jgi:hypothetical protein
MVRNKNKKMELAAKSNTRCVYCNTPETTVLLDIVQNVDKLYNYIRKNAGGSVSAEKANKHRKSFLLLAMQIEKKIAEIAQDVNYHNCKNSGTLKIMLDTALGEQEG